LQSILRHIWQRLPRRIVSVAVLLGCAFLVAWAWPKLAGDDRSGATALYRGFQCASYFPWLGPRFYQLHRDASNFGELDFYDMTVEFEGIGDNKFTARYPNGSLAAKGTCRVTQEVGDLIPTFSPLEEIVDAEFYQPDGALAAKVTRGAGTQVHYWPNGRKQWEIELRESKWVHLREWYDNGQLSGDAALRDGRFDGPSLGYYDNGNKQYERLYVSSKLVGTARNYHPRGDLSTIEYYDPPGELKRTEYYDEKGKLLRTVKP
jgi:antitoxin component YwqK of YwqJK toxin-antitoxin module